jgi:hypothetical protein
VPFKSQAQRRKFAELLVKGEISKETYEEWNRETGSEKLPERAGAKGTKKRATSSKAKGKPVRKTASRAKRKTRKA